MESFERDQPLNNGDNWVEHNTQQKCMLMLESENIMDSVHRISMHDTCWIFFSVWFIGWANK